ncbi:MAG: Gp37 family protein [Acidobacteriota bacterium]
MPEPHADMMDVILARLRAQLPASVDIDELDSREHFETRLMRVPAVFVLFGGLTFEVPKVRATPGRQNQEWQWEVFVAARGRKREKTSGLDYGSLLRSVFLALRGLALGEPGAVLEAKAEEFIEALPGGVVYAQTWTAWRQETV